MPRLIATPQLYIFSGRELARFSFAGSLRVNPRQHILMTLWPPVAGSNVWFYQEHVGYENPTFTMTARCYEEAPHDRWPGS